jgi:hypothetical protein
VARLWWLHSWIGLVLVLGFFGLFLRFFWQSLPEITDSVWLARPRHVLRANDEDYLPELGKYNAGQKFIFWSQTILVGTLFVTGVGVGKRALATSRPPSASSQHRAKALGGSDPCLGGRPGHRHLDHSRLCCNLGARHDQRYDARLRHGWPGLAPSP